MTNRNRTKTKHVLNITRLFLALMLASLALPVIGQTRGQLQRGQYCSALVPPGWSWTGENPAGSAFGADIMRSDRRALASYYVTGVAPEMRTGYYARWYATPDAAAMSALSQLGTVTIQCSTPRVVSGGQKMMSCRTPNYVGVALYQSFPMQNNGYVVVIRTAAAAPEEWGKVGEMASAVSRSIRCNIPLRPSTAEWTSPSSGSREEKRKKEADSEYSQWLGMENYHDSSTGQNYWVNPSNDWNETGPRGPGYYVNIGGETRKLDAGRYP
jgi:hypothetical protein